MYWWHMCWASVEWGFSWALCTRVCRPAPNSICKRLLLSCRRMFQTKLCQLWHKTNNNKEGLWLFPRVIQSNSCKWPATAFGKVLGKALLYVWPRFPKDHLLTVLQDKESSLHSPRVIFSMLSDRKKKCLQSLGKPVVPCSPPREQGQPGPATGVSSCRWTQGLQGLASTLPFSTGQQGGDAGIPTCSRKHSDLANTQLKSACNLGLPTTMRSSSNSVPG